MLVGHILIQHFFHQAMPTWNQMGLWNGVGYNAILTDTRQLPEKTFSAVQDWKPASFPASSPPSQQAHGSQDQGSLRSASLVAWSCRHPSCDETQVEGCSETRLTPLKLCMSHLLERSRPIFQGSGTCRKIFQEILTRNMGISCHAKHWLCPPILVARCGKLFTLDLQVSINMFAEDSTDSFSNRLKSMVPSSHVGSAVPVCATLALFLCKCCEKISVVFPLSSTSL